MADTVNPPRIRLPAPPGLLTSAQDLIGTGAQSREASSSHTNQPSIVLQPNHHHPAHPQTPPTADQGPLHLTTAASDLLTISLIATCFWFFVNILKGIQQEEPFPKKNAIIIFVAAILIFLQTIASDNYNQIFLSEGPAVIKVTSNPFVQALVLIVFGVIYKIASQVAAEHDLTV